MLSLQTFETSQLLSFHSLPDIATHTNELEAIFYIPCPAFNGRGTTYTFSTLDLLLDYLITVDAFKT
jgi:hypothetical protein